MKYHAAILLLISWAFIIAAFGFYATHEGDVSVLYVTIWLSVMAGLWLATSAMLHIVNVIKRAR